MSNSALTIGDFSVRQHDGLFSLNDLHKASGENKSQRPGEFLRLDPTKALIAEIETAGYPAVKTVEGRNGGTYACRELVIAYAAWISAAFHLKVIRVFLNAQVQPPVAAPAQKAIPMPQKRVIKSRDDLSFTRRDEMGRLNNWAISKEDRNRNCADGMELGRHFFLEIADLAKVKPEEAKDAIQFALQGQEFNHGGSGFTNEGWGVEMGFVQAIAQYAIQGLRAAGQQQVALAV